MGDFEGDQIIDPLVEDHKYKSRPYTIIMLLLGLFAPTLLAIYGSEILFQSIFWMFIFSSYGYSGFQIMPYFAILSIFPMILLRLVPVFQINRYYNGKTTKKRALLSTLVGDGYFLLGSLTMLVFSPGFYFMLYIPFPFQILFGFVVLRRYPIPEPITPWEDMPETESWWEKKSETQQEKPSDDEDKLW